jgi:hypothetical protein
MTVINAFKRDKLIDYIVKISHNSGQKPSEIWTDLDELLMQLDTNNFNRLKKESNDKWNEQRTI